MASSGRYQSRLFNFINHQIRQVSEQCEQAFRHLQVTTSWSVQALLYPIYLLFQSTKSHGKQLHTPAQQSQLELPADNNNSQPQTPLTADKPIQRVLLLVDALAAEEPVALPFFLSAPLRFKFFRFRKPEESASSRKRPVVQGIATQLSNRNLVLVTAQNEILDILTSQQQQKLQDRIIGEVANYRHHLAPPSPPPLVLFSSQALGFLDRTFAQLESSHLASASEVAIALAQNSWELVLAVKTRLTVSLSSKAQPHNTRQPAIAPDPAETHTLRIQALIWAAINYFFGNRVEKLGQTKPTDSSLELPAGSKPKPKRLPHRRSASRLPSSPQGVSTDVDPWLTLSDLFGTPEVKPQKKPSSQATQLEPAPEWLETHATAIGYEKHPLEQLLEWLDRAMLRLEKLLVRVFQWVQQLWRAK